ncbi:Tim44/TimA family putative adaptor protein [Alterisphingorhabdus coralli]|uniref:Tim44/TimA family putative adaptor protein n=1 Tax=Alterisphingorhabdus coralli TaxID=3071408 RepID=A0AA97I0K1_9SPHN|nr:Tim44/TimA family putative adaptor protein [Parasphingorhabdus sp. SCSIO 66989]WOE75047.1 Tim44/TimA family putative adaptor protein [Parasphingorhabdus sp. SCSIO 66989]
MEIIERAIIIVSPEIIILAMVAAFLGLRLYSVLGKRTGHEQEPMRRPLDRSMPERTVPESPANEREPQPMGQDSQTVTEFNPAVETAAEDGLRRIANADRQFNPVRFLAGAKTAYDMILEAFWTGNKDDLKTLTDEDVYASFAEVIDAREERGETLENRLVRIEKAVIADAELDGKIARVTVRIDADIASVVRDRDGEMIAGSLTDAVETHDIWTFARDVRSDAPDWVLVETDEA